MAERCPHSPLRGSGWLQGWRLTFGGEGWDGPLPTVVEHQGEHVFVGLYDVTATDEQALDVWESADSGLYQKIRVRVRSEEHTSELQSRQYLVCRLLLEKKKNTKYVY